MLRAGVKRSDKVVPLVKKDRDSAIRFGKIKISGGSYNLKVLSTPPGRYFSIFFLR